MGNNVSRWNLKASSLAAFAFFNFCETEKQGNAPKLRFWVQRETKMVVRKVGKYEIGRTIGEGTFAKVKFAQNTETGESVAMKIIDRSSIIKHKMVDQVPNFPSYSIDLFPMLIFSWVEILKFETFLFCLFWFMDLRLTQFPFCISAWKIYVYGADQEGDIYNEACEASLCSSFAWGMWYLYSKLKKVSELWFLYLTDSMMLFCIGSSESY